MGGDAIDTTVYGDAAQCRAAAAVLDRQGRALYTTESELNYALDAARRHWMGETAGAFRNFTSGVRDETVEVKQESFFLAQQLEQFADALDAVRADMDEARAMALLAGLIIEGDRILAPAAPSAQADLPAPSPVGAPPTPVNPYHACLVLVEDARDRENRAHEALQDAAARVRRAPFLEHWLAKFGFLPESTSVAGLGLWAGNASLFGLGVAAARGAYVTHGAFRPLVGNLRIAESELGRWQRFRHGWSSSSWRAVQGQEAPFARWTSAGKALNVAGAVVAGGTSAWGQWQADADDPTIGTTEQVARAGTVGVASGLGAYGGAVAGGQIGGAIGTAICPGVGTVIGGAIGGAVGGLAGSELGAWAGGEVKGVVGDVAGGIAEAGEALVDAGGQFLDSAGDVVGGGMDKAGDALDKITPW